MNQKKNQGYQNTHRKIKEYTRKFMEKRELSQITVSELCKAAAINRSTFYAHFEDIYDVVFQIEADLEEELLHTYALTDLKGDSAEVVKAYQTVLLQHILNHRRFYQTLFNDPQSPVVKKLLDILKSGVIAPLFHQLSVEPRTGTYYFNFAVSGFIAVIQQWINANCPETPEQLADILFEMMPWRSDAVLDQNFHFQESRNCNS